MRPAARCTYSLDSLAQQALASLRIIHYLQGCLRGTVAVGYQLAIIGLPGPADDNPNHSRSGTYQTPSKAGAGTGSAYDKLGRRGGHTDYAVAGVAASVTRSNGSIGAATVAVTGVGNRPVLATEVADALVGSDGSDAAVEAAAAHATSGIEVLEDLYGSVDYKTHLAGVFTARAVKAALAAAG